MEIVKLEIPDCYFIRVGVIEDNRGSFFKIFNRDQFVSLGLESEFSEVYTSTSNAGVVRGLHFQRPPAAHVKVVYCLTGAVRDVLLDLRVSSPTYGKAISIDLFGGGGDLIYIPKGVAHGFSSQVNESRMIYMTTSCYDPVNDDGVLWSSVDINWFDQPVEEIFVSSRDAAFVSMKQFVSPFCG